MNNPYRQIINVALIFLFCVSTQAQNQLLSERIPVLKSYDADHLHRIALPIGGIGTGTVSLGGVGQLKDWELMNIPAKGFSTVTKGNDAPFFAIYTKGLVSETGITKALLGPIDLADYDHYEGRSVDHHGLPRFRKASFETTYPFGMVHLEDPNMPVKVTLVGYNPFIPGNSEDSGIPIAILQYEVENTSDQTQTVAIAGSLRNYIGKDGRKYRVDWKGDHIPIGANKNQNEYRQNSEVQGIYFYSEHIDKEHPAWGTMSLTTPKELDAAITYRTSSAQNSWGNALLDFWDDFSDDGKLVEKEQQVDDDPMASLSVNKQLAPGEKKVFTFYLTWHYPNRQAWSYWGKESKSRVGNYYTTKYKDAWEVINKEQSRLSHLTDQTISFVNAFMSSSYTDVVKEAALFNVSTLRSQTVFRIEDGKMFGWEGVMDRYGSCYGSCTHVWNYEQSTAFLFGDLARSMREVEFGYATRDNGMMSFRVGLPLKRADALNLAAADGQMGTIMKFYREWQLSGDDEFLKKHWSQVKAALSFAWVPGGWDGDQDGVMEGVQHNTMDVEYYGPNPQMQLWYLGALRAAEKMASHVKDKEFAKKCGKLADEGAVWTDKNLFNGEYYVHLIEIPESKESIAKGTMGHMGAKDISNPDYQLATGCLVDQLVGQNMAHILDLGYLVKPENIRSSLQSIYKYNKRETMYEHFNNMRSYVMGDEKALLMASWPKGGRPKIPFPYWSEVMTGFEYTAAIGMLYEGMDQEGIEVIKNIRDRYDGRKRNPFDETECGRHYARAMIAWSAVLAESGFHYSAVDQSISFTDKPGTYFWANGNSWGVSTITEEAGVLKMNLKVLSGELSLKEVRLGSTIKKYRKAEQLITGKDLDVAVKVK